MSALPRARLAAYREQSGAIRFRIASSPDLHETVEELKRRVPSWARRYDPSTREWSVNADYRTVLEALFINTPSPNDGAGVVGTRRKRDAFAAEARYTSRARMLWVLLGSALVIAAGALFWSRDLQPLATSDAPQAVNAPAPAAASFTTPSAGPVEGRVNAVVNLRAAPGTDSTVLRKAAAGEEVTVAGKYFADDNYWWLTLAGGQWVRSDLVVSAEPGELPIDLSRVPEVDRTGAPVVAGSASNALGSSASGAAAGNAGQSSAGSAGQSSAGSAGSDALAAIAASGPVLYVVDGDTIHVNLNGREVRVRYIGIDTPERDERGYQESSSANRALVQGRTVRLVPDRENVDQYGRLLRYVYVDHDSNPNTPDLFVNQALMEQGWAEVMSIPPNTAFAAEMLAAQSSAQGKNLGLWQ
jgi:endonuclease YncB( thermonuclease family)